MTTICKGGVGNPAHLENFDRMLFKALRRIPVDVLDQTALMILAEFDPALITILLPFWLGAQ